jgi:ferrochelatase
MKGVLLINLGSPESPTAKDVKPYLDEFLMDKYVIDVPFLLRALLVRGIILRKRPENRLTRILKYGGKKARRLLY